MRWLATAGAVLAGIFLGIAAAAYIPFLKNRKTDTAFLLRKAGTAAKTNFHLYSPAILHGVLYVMAPVSALIAMTLREWKSMPEVTELDVRILWATCMSVAMSSWLAFVSKKWGEVEDKKKKLNDTTPPIPPESGRLKTLG